jgi:hypothetical protein
MARGVIPADLDPSHRDFFRYYQIQQVVGKRNHDTGRDFLGRLYGVKAELIEPTRSQERSIDQWPDAIGREHQGSNRRVRGVEQKMTEHDRERTQMSPLFEVRHGARNSCYQPDRVLTLDRYLSLTQSYG